MQQALDKNGSFLQRRKMYDNQFPLHNLKSQFSFDWQGDQHSFQDMHGHRYRIKKQNQEMIKKYNESLNNKIQLKYVDCIDDHQFFMNSIKKLNNKDSLNKQMEIFNQSKLNTSRTLQPIIQSKKSRQIEYHEDNNFYTRNLSQMKEEQANDQNKKSMEYNNRIRMNDYDIIEKEKQSLLNNPEKNIEYVPKYVPKYPDFLNYKPTIPEDNLRYYPEPKKQSKSYNKNISHHIQRRHFSVNPQKSISKIFNYRPPRLSLNFNDNQS